MQTVAVVLAGGSGRRVGSATPKQLQQLGGRHLIDYCVAAFDQAPGVDQVLVVAAADIIPQVTQDVSGYSKVAGIIRGGTARTDSTRAAIGWLSDQTAVSGQPAPGQPAPGQPARGRPADRHDSTPQPDCKVLFHDAARPLVDQRIIADCVSALDTWRAVGVVVPSSDTIVEMSEGRIRRVLPRDSLGRCQTPQGFWLSVISRAYEIASADPEFDSIPATDDCGVVLRYLPAVPIGAVTGSDRNMKITYAADFAIAQTFLDPAQPPDPAQSLDRAQSGS
ncbi:MAG TPA: IspD/TarI family cytidylyltransferase [Streptosporangiaceae bacterium]